MGKVESEETAADLPGEIRMKVVRVGEGRGRENRAREDDAEVAGLERSPRDHSLEHVGSDASHVVVARCNAKRRLVMSA
jgi:hypothetical protein